MHFEIQLPAPLRVFWEWYGRRLILYAGIPYVVVLVMLAFAQRSLIYVPTRVGEVRPLSAGLSEQQAHPISVRASDGMVLHGWHVTGMCRQHADRSACDLRLAEGKPVFLFFSGNGGHRGLRGGILQFLASFDADVFVFDYRGYGENPGSPSERALEADARAAWKYVTVARNIAPERIVLYGESLGGGVATNLAAELCAAGTPPGGLVLCATFSSLVDTAAYHYTWIPVRLLLVDRFPSLDRIPNVTCPLLQVHGTQDRIVPIGLGKRLFDAAPAKSAAGILKCFVEFPEADHNDILDVAQPLYRRALKEFLQRIEPLSAAGRKPSRRPESPGGNDAPAE
jgi:hypothetical protein